MADKLSENAGHFKYLGMRLTDQNGMHEEHWCRLNLGSVWYQFFSCPCWPTFGSDYLLLPFYYLKVYTSNCNEP
jgi:hypothetical protein